MSGLRDGDFGALASAHVVVGQPDVSVTKTFVGTSPLDPNGPTQWDVTVTNSGPVAATAVALSDSDISPSSAMYTSALSVVGDTSNFTSVAGNSLVVDEVPAGGSFSFRVEVPWYPMGWTSPAPADYRVTNRIEVTDYLDPYGVPVSHPLPIRADASIDVLRPDVTLTKELVGPATLAVGDTARYRVTLTNSGPGSAANLVVSDDLPAGFGPITLVEAEPAGSVTCTGTTCTPTDGRLAPGATIRFDYTTATTDATAGRRTNTATVGYTDGTNRTGYTDATGTHSYEASDSAEVELVAPRLSFAKTPELDDPDASIAVDGSASFDLVAANTGDHLASNVTVTDPMPEHLTADLGASTCTVVPAADSGTCVVGGSTSEPTFTVDRLAPGAELRATLSVRHDGSDPRVVGPDIENVAHLSATGFTTISDDGGLNVLYGPRPPLPTKRVSPTSAAPGEVVTYTVDVQLRDANATVHDATLVDVVPDGLTDLTPVSITCTTGSCPATLAYIGFEPSTDGGGRAAWFMGDQPAGTTGTVRVVYTARVAETFVGGGIPVDGTLVRDGVSGGDPIKNAARVWFNDAVDRFTSAPAAVPDTGTDTFTHRSVNTRVSLDIATPKVSITKSAAPTSLDAGDRTNPRSIGTFTLRVRNDGSRPAYAVDVVDDMADGELRDVVVGPLPTGVTTTDEPTAVDPDAAWRIDEIAPGETIEIVYGAVPRPASEMTDSRRSFVNTAAVLGYHSTPGGTGAGDHTYEPVDPVRQTTWSWTPHPRLSLAGCSDPDAVGDATWFSVGVVNSHPLGGPNVADVGTLFDAVLTVTLPANVTFVAGSVVGTPFGGTEGAYRDPDDLTVAPDLTTTMTWNLGDVPSNLGNQFLGLRFKVRATEVSTAGLVSEVHGTDWSGAVQRGDAVNATTPYRASGAAGCGRDLAIQKTPDSGVIPAGGALDWSFGLTAGNGFQHPYTETGRFVDQLPKGFSYVPGTARFSDNSTPADHHETVTALPDGRTEIAWDDVTITAAPRSSSSLTVTVPSRADGENALTAWGTLPRAFVNTVAFQATGATTLGGECNGLPAAVCDSGTIMVESNRQPTIGKTVDHASGPIGDTFTFTVDVSIPANYSAAGLIVTDAGLVNGNVTPSFPFPTPPMSVGVLSSSCVDGCTPGGPDDVVVALLPQDTTGHPVSLGWKTGPIAADTTPRTLRIVYQVQYPDIGTLSELPGCSSAGMALDTSSSCGRLSLRNTAELWQARNSLSTLGSNWRNTMWNYVLQFRGGSTVVTTTQVPDVRVTKACTRPDGTAPGGDGSNVGSPVEIATSDDHVANVECSLEVTNLGPGTAYYIEYEDRPATSSYHGYQTTWDVRTTNTPAPAIVDTTPTNGAAVTWQLPELAEGQSFTTSFEARASLPSWLGGITISGTDPIGARFSNSGAITSYDPDDFGTVHISGGTRRATTWLDIVRPRLNIGKQVSAVGATDPALLTGADDCGNQNLLDVDGHPVCYGPRPGTQLVDTGQPLDYHLVVGLAERDLLRTVVVGDRLPLGWGYVPGSARLDHLDWDGLGRPVTTSTPLTDPTITDSIHSRCESWNSAEGDQLAWTFSPTASGGLAALWDDAQRWTARSTSWNGDFEQTYRVTFRAEPKAAMYDQCEPMWTPGEDPIGARIENRMQLEATAVDGSSITTVATARVRDLDPPRFTKSPATGFASSSSSTAFTLDSDNVQRFALRDATVTDRIFDWSPALGAPLYQPGTATAEDEFGDPVDATETVVHRSTGPDDPSVITWTFDMEPAYAAWEHPRTAATNSCPTSASLQPWYGQCASRVRIRVPLHVPEEEADGHRYTNRAELHLPTRTYEPTDSHYTNTGPVTYGADVADEGQITVVNPSPAPTPTKFGTWQATPNDTVSYDVQFQLPAGTVYHDLAYTDVVPDGLEVTGVDNFTCWTDVWAACDLNHPSVIGPAVAADGSSAVTVFYGDVDGTDTGRLVSFSIRARVMDRDRADRRVVAGDQFVDAVTGFSNEDDVESTPTVPVTTAQHRSLTATFTTVIDEPRLTIEKLADRSGPVAAGDVVNYTIRLRNASNVTAYSVPVDDRPNAALTDVALTGDTSRAVKGWTVDDPTLAWQIDQLSPGQSVDLTYRAVVGPDPQTTGAVENVADVGIYQGRPTASAANREYDGPEVTHRLRFLSADLRLTKVPNPTGANPCPTDGSTQVTTVGRATPWCVTVTNAGEDVAGSVVTRDLLPKHWTYTPASATVDGTPTEPVLTDVGGSWRLQWNLGDLPAGASRVIRYTAVPGPDAAPTARNTAWATAQRPDGTAPPAGAPGFRASATASAELDAVGVSIAKTPDRALMPFVPDGGRASWTITVENPAATDLTGVEVTDTFPVGLGYVATETTTTCPGAVETVDAATPAGRAVHWTFPSLPVGASCTIEVSADVPAGLSGPRTYVNDAQVRTDQTPSAAANQAKLVVYEPAHLGDRVWHDLDGDGLQDAAEPGLPGVVVAVGGRDVEDHLITRLVTTDATGTWDEALPPGTYTAQVVTSGAALTGFHTTLRSQGTDAATDSDATDDGTLGTVTLGSGDTRRDLDAGFLTSTAGLSGVRWHDLDGDGIRDAGEPLLSGIRVLLQGTTGAGTPLTLETVTGPDGSWTFSGLPPVRGTVTFDDPAGTVMSAPNRGTDDSVDSDADPADHAISVDLPSAGLLTHLDAGSFVPARVVATVWLDRDRDGVRDPDEEPAADRPVTLVGLDAGGNPVEVTVRSGSDGSVRFDGVVPGTYVLRYDTDLLTTPDAGTDDVLDSDAASGDGETPEFTVSSGAAVTGGDAGYVVPTNVTVAKTVIDGPTADRLVTYRLRVTNDGDLPTTGAVDVVDELPTQLAVVSVDGAGWTCALPTGSGAGGRVTCTTTAPIAAGDRHDVVLVARLGDDATGAVVNGARVEAADLVDNGDVTDDDAAAEVEVSAVLASTTTTSVTTTTTVPGTTSTSTSTSPDGTTVREPDTTVTAPDGRGTGGSLAFTGGSVGGLVLLGLGAVVVGVSLRRRARRA